MFEGLANFFQGKGFVNNAQLDEEKRRQQQAAQPAPSKGGLTVSTANPQTSLRVGQVQTPQIVLQKPTQAPSAPQPAAPEPDFWQKIGAGLQQAGGGVLDTLIKGGSTLTKLGTMTNPFLNEEKRQRRLQQDVAAGDVLRQGLMSQQDLTGQNIVGTSDVEENARRITTGEANAEDYARVLGKGFDVANTVTAAVPVGSGFKLGANLLQGGVKALGGNVARASVPLLKEAATLGTTATGADVLSGRGVSPESLAINYGLPVAFGGAGAAAGAGFRAGRTALQRGVAQGSEAEVRSQALATAKNSLLETAAQVEKVAAETPTSQLGKLDDGISSEVTAQAKRQAAQDSATQLRQQADEIVVDTPQVETPQVTSQNLDTPLTLRRATPEELNARANQGDPAAIDEINQRFDEAQAQIANDAAAPTPDAPVAQAIDPVQPIDNRLESPITAESRAIAETATPVVPENQLDILRAEARQYLDDAESVLNAEGTTVGQLGEKLYVADVNGTPANLTPTEKRVFDELNSRIGDARKALVEAGIDSGDIGVRSNYLPTGKASEIERNTPLTVEDINADTFTFGKKRSGGFINEDGTTSPELSKGIKAAFEDYYVKGMGSKNLSDPQVDDIKTARYNQMDIADIASNADGSPSGIQLNESQNKLILDSNKKLVTAERAVKIAVKSGDEDAIEAAQMKLADTELDKLTNKYKAVFDAAAEQKKAINSANIPYSQKAALISQIDGKVAQVRADIAYQQTYVKTNMLLQIPGRVADQVGKLTQVVNDTVTSVLANLGAGASSKRSLGYNIFRGGKDSREVLQVLKDEGAVGGELSRNFKLNRSLNNATAKTWIGKRLGDYKAVGTAATELGSRNAAPLNDTVRLFTAQGQADGLSGDALTDFVRSKIGTTEWDRTYQTFYTARNRFSGVPSMRASDGTLSKYSQKLSDKIFDGIKSSLESGINKLLAPVASQSVRKNIFDAISVPLVGFPRVVFNVGAKGMDYATLGMGNFYKAARINVVDDATALQKALAIKSGIESAQVGGGMIGLGILMGQAGMITGSKPEKQANGEWIPPYSLKLGDDYFELGRFIGPNAVPLMLAAAISRGDSALDIGFIVPLVASQISQNFGADSIGDTMSNIGDALNGDTSGVVRYIPNILSAFAPLSGGLNSIANATDPYQRETKNDDPLTQFVQQLQAKVPGLRQGLDAKVDQFNNPLENSPLKAVLPINTVSSGFSDSTLGSETGRLKVQPSGSSNTPENAEAFANRLIESEWYKSLDDEGKKDALQSTLYSEKLKDINDSLGDEQKDALMIGTLMDADTRDKWLEDKANAAAYNVGRYENAIANNTLTAADDDLETSSSLHYKAIASQVNATLPYWTATLEEQYKNTTKKELLAMAPDNPVRQALLALDEARAGAGVSLKDGDHAASKYGAGSGGSGSGSGGDNFSFASANAVNAEKTGFAQPTIKSDFSTTLVKPLGIGEASNKAKRKITVKKGVVL